MLRKDRLDWSGIARFVPDKLGDPIGWRDPKMIFVNSMSDLFHHDVDTLEIAAAFGVMALACHHTYQILTKRPERALEVLSAITLDYCWEALDRFGVHITRSQSKAIRDALPPGSPFAHDGTGELWPLPNVWLGVSVENQQTANARVPLLLQVPAAVRWLSIEPLLEPVDLSEIPANLEPIGAPDSHGFLDRGDYFNALDGSFTYSCSDDAPESPGHYPTLDWAVVGGESGNKARPCEIEWIRSIVEQFKSADVPVFVKQLGSRPMDPGMGGSGRYLISDKKGGEMAEWPEDLRVREWPRQVMIGGVGPDDVRVKQLPVEIAGAPEDEIPW